MNNKYKVKKYAVEYYYVLEPSYGGHWKVDTFADINEAVGCYLKNKSGYMGTYKTRFYMLQLVPLKISWASKIKEFILHFKVPKSLDITIK